jgi:hypothetical protein
MSEVSIRDKYLESLKMIGGWVIVSEWAVKFGEMYPELLAKAHQEALKQKKPSTGLREIAARMSSAISTGAFEGKVEVDESERPRKVRYLSEAEAKEYLDKEIEEDIEPLSRAERIQEDEKSLDQRELYRANEFYSIADDLKKLFRLDFEVDHASALLCRENSGKHHPDNLQLLTKAHNGRKNNCSWNRFSFEEQVEYIKAAVRLQKIVEAKMGVQIDDSLIENIIARLRLVF